MMSKWALCAVVFAAAFLFRSLPFPWVFSEYGTLPYGYDAYYHLRRILWSVENFPAFLSLDPYLAFPAGGRAIWSPLMDWTLAALFRVYPGPEASAEVERMVVWMPPLVGGAVAVGLYRLALRHFSPRIALLAVCIFIPLPIATYFGQVGYVDHHILVQLCGLIVLAASMEMMRGDLPVDRRAKLAVLLGASWAFAIAVWPGSLIHVGLSQLALLLGWLGSKRDDADDPRLAWHASVAHAAAAALLLPICLTAPRSLIDPLVLSGFQPLWLACGALCFAGVALGHSWLGERGGGLLDRLLLASLVGGLVLGVALLGLGSLQQSSLGAFEWLLRNEGFQSVVGESTPLFMNVRGELDTAGAELTYSRLIYLFPIWLLAELVLLLRSSLRPERALLLLWSTGLFGATLVQHRFGDSFCVAFALECALGLATLHSLLQSRIGRPRIRIALGLVALCVLVWAVIPVLDHLREATGTAWVALRGGSPTPRPYVLRDRPLVELARWLRSATPTTAGYWSRADEAPEYGVLSNWSFGHLIRHHAQRPVVQDNFGDDVSPENFALSEAYFMAATEAKALEILERLRVRYVVVDNAGSGHMKGYPHHSQFVRLFQLRGSAGAATAPGSHRGRMQPALERHRLIYASPPPANRRAAADATAAYQVFEIVPGALLVGSARAGSRVSVELDLTVNRASPLRYRAESEADAGGRYFFRVPYPNGLFSSEISAATHYRVSSGGTTRQLRVSEDDVMNAGTVEAPAFDRE